MVNPGGFIRRCVIELRGGMGFGNGMIMISSSQLTYFPSSCVSSKLFQTYDF